MRLPTPIHLPTHDAITTAPQQKYLFWYDSLKNSQVTAEKAADGSGDWATVKLRVGVTRDKLRTLVMQFYADTRVSWCKSFVFGLRKVRVLRVSQPEERVVCLDWISLVANKARSKQDM